jgi:single-strand DNA-binding protein
MASFNKIILIGRLTKDPENNFSKEGTSITKFDFACDIGFGESKRPMFIGVTAFGKTADFVMTYFKKGGEILIEGSLDFQQWDDKETGKKRSKHAVIANQVSFIGSNKKEGAEPAQAESKPVSEDTETIPF